VAPGTNRSAADIDSVMSRSGVPSGMSRPENPAQIVRASSSSTDDALTAAPSPSQSLTRTLAPTASVWRR